MQQIPVYYYPEMSVYSGGYSPSASKPERVVADWQAADLPHQSNAFITAELWNKLSDFPPLG